MRILSTRRRLTFKNKHMDIVKVGYNIKSVTALDENIIQKLKYSDYYQDRFYDIVKDKHIVNRCIELNGKGSFLGYEIKAYERINDSVINHTIVYEFKSEGSFNKTEMKKFIYERLNKKFNT